MRNIECTRKTNEVEITLKLDVDGKGDSDVQTGIMFLDHILITLAKHSLFDLKIKAKGDLKHHISEDVVLVLGEALNKGNKQG